MKIALCISGYMRLFDKTFSNLKINFLNLYPETDIFIHTWHTLDYWNHQLIDKIKIQNLYNPKNIIIEQQMVLPTTPIMIAKNHEKLRNTNNVLSMFYKIKQCNDLKSKYEQENNFKYDCVIRFRSDIDLKENLIIDKSKLDFINIPKYGDFGGLNDQFAFSNSINMNIYSALYDEITNYLNNNSNLCMCPEWFLKHHIEFNNLQLNRPEIKYVLMKRENEILDNEKREREFVNIK